jgi:hypothetical protein
MRLDKIKKLIELGYSYEPLTGDIISPNGKVHNTVNDRYKCIRLRNKKVGVINVYHHQFAYYWVHGEVVECIDHINGNRLDNRIENLRSVTSQQNNFNMKNVKGFSQIKNLYQSRIKVDNKLISLGYFNNESDAHNAYLSAKKIYHKM